MNSIRERLFETKALDEMDKNAFLEDVKCDISLLFSFEAKLSKGGTTPVGPKYSLTSETWEISRKELKEIKNTDNLTRWVNENYESRKKRGFLRYKKCVIDNIHINPTLYFKISHYNDNTNWAKNSLKITTKRHYEPLVSQYFNVGEAYVEPTQESAEIIPNGFNSNFDIIDSTPMKRRGTINSLVIEFLSKDTPWINGKFGDFESSEDMIKIPLLFENNSHYLHFKNAEDISSPIWELASVFDYDDPWNLRGEKFQLTFNPLCVSSESYKHDIIHIREYNDNKKYSNFDRIRTIFS